MNTIALRTIRRMRGGSQSQLMLDSAGVYWVVKFQNNPQDLRILANEFIATKLAEAVGLSVPQCTAIDVPEALMASTSDMYMELGNKRLAYAYGLQFGSRYVGQSHGSLFDYLPDTYLTEVKNVAEFCGILCLDKWLGNCDGRQAVFSRASEDGAFFAHFIDHGFCFDAGNWAFRDAPLYGVYRRTVVYTKVTGWDSFEPWLSRFETTSPDIVWDIVKQVPGEWYDGRQDAMSLLIERLLRRRSRLREMILSARFSEVDPFPQWV